jgi:hypothetical protein
MVVLGSVATIKQHPCKKEFEKECFRRRKVMIPFLF